MRHRFGMPVLFWVLVSGSTSASVASLETCPDCDFSLVYDARVGIFEAGTMTAQLVRDTNEYQLFGALETSGPISRFISWRGRYAAKGILIDKQPETHTYLLFEEYPDDDELEVVMTHKGSTHIYERGKEPKVTLSPEGIDVMSALILMPNCRDDLLVHDGEDTYTLKLVGEKSDQHIRQGRNHYSGLTHLCKYRFVYESGHVRKIDIWLATVGNDVVPARIRIRVPVLPDGLLKLRIDQVM